VTGVCVVSRGRGTRRAIACFDQALSDVGIEALAQALHDYFAWATRATMSRYHESADDVPDGLEIPKWSWDGLIKQTDPDES
jgi:hemoglobin